MKNIVFLKLPFLYCWLLAALPSKAQSGLEGRAAKAIYVEVAGSSPGLSLNYDTRFRAGLTGLGVRAGVGVMGGFSEGALSGYTAPFLLNYVLGKGRIALEIGAGVAVGYATRTGTNPLTGVQVNEEGFLLLGSTGNLGLRLQPAKTGLQGRLYWSPFLTGDGLSLARIGLSLGVGFR
ncbi:hypothetical protein ACFSUS_15160 [Spirosoma soli]|uniref:Outer membrane protein beta-barrel domain-containing protein n=1 Tax=Spirosoma soli TaxID=1770529 RepID=A0ABW5M639_9BACT